MERLWTLEARGGERREPYTTPRAGPPHPPHPTHRSYGARSIKCQVPAALGAGNARARERLANSLRVLGMAGGTTRAYRPSALALAHACCTPIDLQSGGIRLALTLSRALAAAAPEREYLGHVGGQRNGMRGRKRKGRLGTVWWQEREAGRAIELVWLGLIEVGAPAAHGSRLPPPLASDGLGYRSQASGPGERALVASTPLGGGGPGPQHQDQRVPF